VAGREEEAKEKVGLALVIAVSMMFIISGIGVDVLSHRYYTTYGVLEKVEGSFPKLGGATYLVEIPPDNSGVSQYLIFVPGAYAVKKIANGHPIVSRYYSVEIILITNNASRLPYEVSYTMRLYPYETSNPITVNVYDKLSNYSLSPPTYAVARLENGTTYHVVLDVISPVPSELPEKVSKIVINEKTIKPAYYKPEDC